MMPEVSLMAVLVIVFIADFFTAPRVADVQAGADFKAPRAWFGPLVCVLMLVHTLLNLAPVESAVTFGGMYYTTPSIGIIKSILAFGTLIVLIQSREWMRRPDTFFKEGEFYMLTLATLLGMNMMVSANHFLLFFLGLELASVPMACLVAFDKYRHNSAEAGAKFILTATFSSGVMLYGISLLYGAVGTLYFDDVVMRLSLPLLWSSWVWCSSSAVWASRFLSCPSTSGQPTLTRALPPPLPAICRLSLREPQPSRSAPC